MAWTNSDITKQEVIHMMNDYKYSDITKQEVIHMMNDYKCGNYGAYKNAETKTQTEWKFETNKVSTDGKCPCCPTQKTIVTFADKAIRQIKTLCDEYPQLEWMAGLIGRTLEDGNKIIDEIKLFNQKVTGCHVEYTDTGNAEMSKTPTIGWIHSHNIMAAFMSGEDLDTAAQTEGLSLVVNNKLEFGGVIRTTLPCQRHALQTLEFKYIIGQEQTIIEEAKTLIQQETYTTNTTQNTIEQKIQTNDDTCIICGDQVGKRRKTLKCGVTHKGCFKQYKKEIEYHNDTEMTDQQTEEYLNNITQLNFCNDCGMPKENCQCHYPDEFWGDYN